MQSRLPNNSKETADALQRSGIRLSYDDSRYRAFQRWTGSGKRVLYIGGNGATLLCALQQSGCTIIAVEFDPVAAEAVRSFCDRVLVTNAENLDIAGLVEGEQFDVVLLDDVLEVLRQPSELLTRLRLLLSNGGSLLASASNFTHGAIRLALLSGSFDPTFFHGSVDGRSRFFTYESLQRLCDEAQLEIDGVERVMHPIMEPSPRLPLVDEDIVDRRAVAAVAADPESTTLEFLVRTTVANRSDVLPELSVSPAHADALAEEAANLRTAIADRDDALAQLDDVVTLLEHEKASLETQCQTLRREREDLRRALEGRTRDIEELNHAREHELREAKHRESELVTLAEDALTLPKIIEERERDLREAAKREAQLLVLAEDAVMSLEAAQSREALSSAYLQELEEELERAWSDSDALRTRFADYEAAATQAVNAAESAASEIEQKLTLLQSAFDSLGQREEYARARNESLEPLARQLEEERTRLTSELQSAQSAVASLRERLQALEQRFVDQTNGMIAATEAETQRIASLIDAVQTSKFWTLKRWVRKLTGRR